MNTINIQCLEEFTKALQDAQARVAGINGAALACLEGRTRHRQETDTLMLLPNVDRAIRRHGLIRPGERVLVAVSGGPDSVALTQALAELAQGHGFELRLAHLNHQLRQGADADEAFCEQWAKSLRLPLATDRIDVALEARRSHCSLEEQARNSRYRFLGATAARWNCRRVAVGHTRDDQAETFLLRLLRGAGIKGLAAMGPVSSLDTLPSGLIRPMLEVTRSQVLAFLESRHLPYRQDPSNEDRSIPRNFVRHETLPFLAARHNPNLVATLARTTDLLRDDEDWMAREASRVLGDLMGGSEDDSDRLYLPVGELVALHPALQRRVVRGAIHLVRGNLRALTARHVEDVLRLAGTGSSGRRLFLPGLVCGRSFSRLWFERDGPRDVRLPSEATPASSWGTGSDRPARRYNGYEYVLTVPGELAIPEAGGAIRVEEAEASFLPEATGDTVKVALREVDVALRVRNLVPGDRFQPLGAPGSKSVSRYLMERRVDRDRRRQIPLVVRSDEEILWVAGYAISEASRIGADASRVLRLSWLTQ